MKYLIAGLGNPGIEYTHTRHNIGFMVADRFVELGDAGFADKRHAFIAETRLKNKLVYLIKPLTFMNLSGKAVRYWLSKLNIPLENLLVVTDDIALPLGKLRLRGKGSDGGHNGLANIQTLLGSAEYPRLRFGIGGNFPRGRQVDYVLNEFNEDEWPIIKDKIDLSVEIIKSFVLQGISPTMSQYNNN